MSRNLKYLLFRKNWRLYTLSLLLIITVLFGILPLFEPKIPAVEADFEIIPEQNSEIPQFSVIQNNSLTPISYPDWSKDDLIVIEQIPVIVTAYSSTPEETDSSPRLTAAGTWVREGIVANNFLPFGTKNLSPFL